MRGAARTGSIKTDKVERQDAETPREDRQDEVDGETSHFLCPPAATRSPSLLADLPWRLGGLTFNWFVRRCKSIFLKDTYLVGSFFFAAHASTCLSARSFSRSL